MRIVNQLEILVNNVRALLEVVDSLPLIASSNVIPGYFHLLNGYCLLSSYWGGGT